MIKILVTGDAGFIGSHNWNLGTGQGYSVLEMIKAFQQASGKKTPYKLATYMA